MERFLLLILIAILGFGVVGAFTRPTPWRLNQDGTPHRSSSSGVVYNGRRSGGVWVGQSFSGRRRGESFVGRGPRGVK
ncbi:MAG: hypothetical protein ACON4T_00250 [Synechococcus sp.]